MVLLDVASIAEFICPPVLGLTVKKNEQSGDGVQMSLLGTRISPGSKTHNLSFTFHLPLLPHSILQVLGEEGGPVCLL